MSEILPNGEIQSYCGYCKKCGAEIRINMQGMNSDHKCGDKMEKKWCMCIELKGVARDGFSTCMICSGKDAYGKSTDRGTKYQKNTAQQHPENTFDARDADYRG